MTTWYITGVQLEVGTSATPFEFLPYDVNLDRCFRYFQDYTEKLTIIRGFGYNVASGIDQPYQLIKEMRSNPTVTISEGSDGGSSTQINAEQITNKKVGFSLDPTNSSQTIYYQFKFTTDAEL